MSFYLEANGYIELVLTLNERKARQAASSQWGFRGAAGWQERGALTSGGEFHT